MEPEPGYNGDQSCVEVMPLLLLRSLCPTFSAIAMFINNARWDGVPFLLKVRYSDPTGSPALRGPPSARMRK